MKDNKTKDVVFRFITELDDEALIDWKESLIKRYDEIQNASDIVIDDQNYTDVECRAIKTDLIQINKELSRRGIAIGDTVFQNAVSTDDGIIFCEGDNEDVKRIRIDFYKWIDNEELHKTASIEAQYSDEILLKDLFLKLGLTHGVFNLLDSKNRMPVFIQIPFIEKDNTVLWNQTFETIKLNDYLSYFDYTEICVCPFNPSAVGGIGAAGADLLMELYQSINQFCAQNPLITNIISDLIWAMIGYGASKAMKPLRELSDRGATFENIKSHLSLRDCWSERELLCKYSIDSAESLEYLMLGLGYAKKDGIYTKMKTEKDEK